MLHGSCYMVGCVTSVMLYRVWSHGETVTLQSLPPGGS